MRHRRRCYIFRRQPATKYLVKNGAAKKTANEKVDAVCAPLRTHHRVPTIVRNIFFFPPPMLVLVVVLATCAIFHQIRLFLAFFAVRICTSQHRMQDRIHMFRTNFNFPLPFRRAKRVPSVLAPDAHTHQQKQQQ